MSGFLQVTQNMCSQRVWDTYCENWPYLKIAGSGGFAHTAYTERAKEVISVQWNPGRKAKLGLPKQGEPVRPDNFPVVHYKPNPTREINRTQAQRLP